MLISDHVGKVRKLQVLRSRLDPLADFELWFWATMHAGTHALNAALHAADVTAAEDAWATQPGVYLVVGPQGLRVPAFRELGDVIHVGRPPVTAPVPKDVESMMHAMECIERWRDPCVREGVKPTVAIVGECEGALRACLASLEARLEV